MSDLLTIDLNEKNIAAVVIIRLEDNQEDGNIDLRFGKSDFVPLEFKYAISQNVHKLVDGDLIYEEE